MMYTKITNETVEAYPYSISQLRKDNPNTSFPKNLPTERLTEWGVYPVAAVNVPQVVYTQNVIEGDPVQLNGAWTQNWVVTDATTEEIAQREADAWSNLRSTRNAKLSDTDWTQVADAPVDQAAWATYRQALRDLPANTADPFNPVWPVEPA